MKDWSSWLIRTKEDLEEMVRVFGIVPFFPNAIRGFSIRERVDPKIWFTEEEGPWEWKGPAVRTMKCAYGKFLKGKAMYISPKWFPDFANFRRDGYDFDARYDDGLAPFHDKELYELLDANAPVLSKELKQIGGYGKNGRKGFDASVTRLQKQCYVVVSDFRYAKDRLGNEYGWGIAEYSTPEKFMGKKFSNAVYKRTPEESYARVLKHLKKILPDAGESEIERILG